LVRDPDLAPIAEEGEKRKAEDDAMALVPVDKGR